MIVNIPIKEQVYDPDNLMKKYKINDQRLPAFSQQSQIPYCDTKAKLTNHADQNYFKFDSHLTPVGHQQVAAAIENCLINNISFIYNNQTRFQNLSTLSLSV